MRALVVAPHSDDETLGAGGTLLKLKKQGNQVYFLNVTMANESNGYSKDFSAKRKEQLDKVAQAYDFDGVYNLQLEPAGLDKLEKQELVTEISAVFKEVNPEIIFLPYEKDPHSDHGIVFEASYSCTKAFRNSSIKAILAMEILSETDFANPEHGFIPDVYVDVEEFIDKKIEIMQIYESEIGELPFPRNVENIKSLATYRGCSSGCRYAEAFKLIKAIWR